MKRGSYLKIKKGLSTIVSTLLILLLVFVAIGILWVVVRNVIQGGAEQVSLGKFTLDLAIDQVQIYETGNDVSVKVKRNPGAGEFIAIKFIFSDGENSETFDRNVSLKEYERKDFVFTLQNINKDNLKMIQIAPIFRLESGKEVVGDVKGSWEKGAEEIPYVELEDEEETVTECEEDSQCTGEASSENYCSTDTTQILRDNYVHSCNLNLFECQSSKTTQVVQTCQSGFSCQGGSCISNSQQLVSNAKIISVSASGYDSNGPYTPEKSLDGSLNFESRWSSEGSNEWIVYELNQSTYVSYVRIAFFGSAQRYFDIQYSTDGSSWINTTAKGLASTANLAEQYQPYSFTPVSAKYIRFLGHGSSAPSLWNSIVEMDINGFESDVVTTPVCVPESSSVTCSGKCGTQTNNCGTSVNCGVCESGEVFEGEVIYVTSPGNGNSINSNFNSALSQAQNGDVIVLPAGNFIVTSQLSVNKFVSIIGHGSGSGGTMLQKQVGSSFSYVIRYDDNYNPGPNEFLVISGIYVRGYDVSRTDVGLFIQQDNFVVTNSKFEEFGFAGIYVKHDEDEPHGVIYNNEFIHNCRNNLGYGVSVIGRDTEWIDDPEFGTDKFIFIEDNYFSEHRHSVASSGTGKYVARYNTIIDNICQGGHPLDMHEARCASLGSGNHFAARAAEIYGNNITNYRVRDIHGGVPIVPNGNIEQLSFSGVGIRGGEAVIWDNYIEGFVYGVRLYIQPSSGECGAQYPMLTQIGYQSALDYGSSHTGTDASHAAGDVFSWSNTFDNYDSTDRSFSDWNSRGTSSTYPDFMLDPNRDYHLVAKPGYTPYTYPHPLRVSVEQKISNLNL